MIAEVVINSPARELGKVFDYKISDELSGTVTVGQMVTVPFGVSNREEKAFVVNIKEKSEFKRLKAISKVIDVDFILGEKEFKLANWISKTYFCNLGVALNLFFTDKVKAKIKNEEKVIEKSFDFTPTIEQKNAIDLINSTSREDNFNEFLLHGVTGSGKTEVYIQVIKHFISKGYGAIVLVPEISLTPQTVNRFKSRLGDMVAVFHSRLSRGEKYIEWEKINRGQAKVVVGARSALFTPIKNLGIVIIDEEHDSSYKSGQSPYYHARDVARELCRLNNATLVLGSATPDVTTYYDAIINKSKLLTLKERANHNKLPEIDIIDMRDELINGNKTIFSRKLYDEIKKNIENREQTILFLNRRGFSTFVSCRKCGFVAKCRNCNIALTYHMDNDFLECHYCGAKFTNPKTCPICHENYIKYFGIGTQKVENAINKIFPHASVLRMDLDTTLKKNSHEELLNKFRNENIDILIGTQMIAKGHDFPNVTLVGVIAADTSINTNDFRSGEITFDLLTQVAGRAGRASKNGRAIIQTYEPDNYSILAAKDHDYESFYSKEILLRENLLYPPFCDIVLINITGKDEREVIESSRIIREEFGKYFSGNEKVQVLKEVPAPISKINNKYRFRIIIKSNNYQNLNNEINYLLNSEKFVTIKNVDYTIDYNPIMFN